MSDSVLQATLNVTEASQRDWDVLVIGAGPSGAIAARQCAQGGGKVLLVNDQKLPRDKVCGCCLNGAALEALNRIGLNKLVSDCHAPILENFVLASGQQQVALPLGAGVSLSRQRLDLELTQAAIDAGAQFLDETRATLHASEKQHCSVMLNHSQSEYATRARITIIARGLGRRVFSNRLADERRTNRNSRIGAGAVLSEVRSDFKPKTIYMACHRSGYVGCVRLEDGRLDLAAALDANAVKQAGGIGPLASIITNSAGLPASDAVAAANWRGTAKLTQSRATVYGDRLFVVGDAAGYVEPFTGEGMAWAIASGIAVAPLALQSLKVGTTETGPTWAKSRTRLLGGRMWKCRLISQLLRRPKLVKAAAWGLSHAPGLSRPFIRSLNRPFPELRS